MNLRHPENTVENNEGIRIPSASELQRMVNRRSASQKLEDRITSANKSAEELLKDLKNEE